MALKKEEIFQEKPSKEETIYASAVSLMNAVDCLERFEREVDALRDAAERFEQLGDYKEAKQYRMDCLELADEAEEKGCQKTYELAIRKKKDAVTKSDYVDAMEEFRRLRSYEPYRAKVKQEIQECKEKIRHLETMAAYKRRGLVFLTLLIIAAALTQTPLYPVAKGVVHRYRGEYRAALNCYAEAEYLPGVGKLQRYCYYQLAGKAEERGQEKKAMKLYRLAGRYQDAAEHTAVLEKKLLQQTVVGDKVSFGGRNWIILEKQSDRVMMLAASAPQFKKFDQDGGFWEDSSLKSWLDNSFLSQDYSQQEQEMVLPADKKGQDKVFLLSEREYRKYRDLIPEIQNRWWLCDNTIEPNHAKCVLGSEILTIPADTKKIGVRPAIWVTTAE
ncbi:MAG: hypothetical protein K2J67_04845 [Lachnospiraceae bacterium]|nr:hypothetical protein [Lachnospiraceae bacterium]